MIRLFTPEACSTVLHTSWIKRWTEQEMWHRLIMSSQNQKRNNWGPYFHEQSTWCRSQSSAPCTAHWGNALCTFGIFHLVTVWDQKEYFIILYRRVCWRLWQLWPNTFATFIPFKHRAFSVMTHWQFGFYSEETCCCAGFKKFTIWIHQLKYTAKSRWWLFLNWIPLSGHLDDPVNTTFSVHNSLRFYSSSQWSIQQPSGVKYLHNAIYKMFSILHVVFFSEIIFKFLIHWIWLLYTWS